MKTKRAIQHDEQLLKGTYLRKSTICCIRCHSEYGIRFFIYFHNNEECGSGWMERRTPIELTPAPIQYFVRVHSS